MATFNDTTFCVPSGTPSTALSQSFRLLTASLPALIEDERDLAGYTGQDPAVDAWIRAAERSRASTLRLLDAVIAAPVIARADRFLRAVAHVFRAVMLSCDVREVRYLTGVAEQKFFSADLSPDARRLISFALYGLRSYVSIEAPVDGALADLVASEPDMCIEPADSSQPAGLAFAA